MLNKNLRPLTRKDYDEALNSIIPELQNFPAKYGKEGVAFFIDENYVIKRITNSYRQERISQLFDFYIKEQVEFANKGYLIPRIYSYAIVKNTDIFGNSHYSFYVLEQRFKGRDVFLNITDIFYEKLKQICREEKYNEHLNNSNCKNDEFYALMSDYVYDFISQNVFLDSLSQDKFDKLIYSAYKMFKEGKYSVPDVHAGNLLVNKDGFNIIDNYIIDKESKPYFVEMPSDKFLLTRFLNVFRGNFKAFKVLSNPKLTNIPKFQTLYKLKKENSVYSQSVLQKMMISIKKCVSSEEEFELSAFIASLRHYLRNYLENNEIEELTSAVEKGE